MRPRQGGPDIRVEADLRHYKRTPEGGRPARTARGLCRTTALHSGGGQRQAGSGVWRYWLVSLKTNSDEHGSAFLIKGQEQKALRKGVSGTKSIVKVRDGVSQQY